MSAMTSQITSLTIVYSMAYSGADKKKTPKFRITRLCVGIHRWLVNFLHKWQVTQKKFPYDGVIMEYFVEKSEWKAYITA